MGWNDFGSGLYRLLNGKFTRWDAGSDLSCARVRAIHAARRGGLWFGTRGGGLSLYQEGKFRRIGKDALPDSVVALHEDVDGILWIGTNRGLSRLEGETVTNYGPEHGFPPQGILQILEDNSGRLWMSQKTGVLRVNKSELNAASRTRAHQVTIVRYGKADGIRSGSCNGGAQPAGCKSGDGRLWFPTDRGVAVVDPSHLGQSPVWSR
jgi:ligand-binding sensor domain-containing protein